MSIISAMREFGIATRILSQVMVPSTPRKERRKVLNSVINELSEDTFNRGIIANRILNSNMIDMSEPICKQYNGTKEQVDGVLSWLPRMEYHRERLEKAIKQNRKKYGLPI